MSERQFRRVQNRRLRRAIAWLLRELARDFNALVREGVRP
jgi:hypothetical protein